jgi:hypothetical protein
MIQYVRARRFNQSEHQQLLRIRRPANVSVCVWAVGGGGRCMVSVSVKIHAKTTLHWSLGSSVLESMFHPFQKCTCSAESLAFCTAVTFFSISPFIVPGYIFCLCIVQWCMLENICYVEYNPKN